MTKMYLHARPRSHLRAQADRGDRVQRKSIYSRLLQGQRRQQREEPEQAGKNYCVTDKSITKSLTSCSLDVPFLVLIRMV